MERTGVCKNVGPCMMAGKKQYITDDDAEFVCTECGEELEEFKDAPVTSGADTGVGRNKMPLIIGGVVGVLVAIGVVVFLFMPNKNEIVEAPVVESAVEVTEIIETPAEEILPISEEEVEPVKEEKPIPPTPPKIEEEKKQPTGGGSSTINVKGGKYTGEVKNGKPHGQGTLTYNSRTLISSRDMKNRYAEAGQYVTGEFYEGELVQGKLFNTSNEQIESLILGRP